MSEDEQPRGVSSASPPFPGEGQEARGGEWSRSQPTSGMGPKARPFLALRALGPLSSGLSKSLSYGTQPTHTPGSYAQHQQTPPLNS